MRTLRLIFLATALCAIASASDNTPVLGSWEGESKCTVPNSPCHDEHALYKISPDKKDATKLSLDAYKLINRAAEYMGTITCSYTAPKLTCSGNTVKKDIWEFQVSGDNMSGTLKIGDDHALYRQISLHRTLKKAN